MAEMKTPTTDVEKARSRRRKRRPSGPGRPFKLTDERIDRICQALATGATRMIAARYGGLDETTYYRYLRDGRQILDEGRTPDGDRETLLVALVERIEEAEVEAELRLLGNIAKAGNEGDWRASAHILARRWPDRWADRAKLEVTGQDGGPIGVEANGGGILDVLGRHALPAGDDPEE